MKKYAIFALSTALILSLFAGCRRNVPQDTTKGTTESTT